MECIFDYDLNVIEYEVLNPVHNTKALYLLFTPKAKILSDLHLLFLIRRDRDNCERIREMFRDYEEGVKNLLNQGSFSSCPFLFLLIDLKLNFSIFESDLISQSYRRGNDFGKI